MHAPIPLARPPIGGAVATARPGGLVAGASALADGVVTLVVALGVGTVTLNATTANLPGGPVLQTLVNDVGGFALILSLVGLVIGAALWALGAHSQNYQQSYVGRRAVLISGLAALLIGAAPGLINFFFHAGLKVN